MLTKGSPDSVGEWWEVPLLVSLRSYSIVIRHKRRDGDMSIFKTVPRKFKSAAITVKKYFISHINSLKIGYPLMIFDVCIQLYSCEQQQKQH